MDLEPVVRFVEIFSLIAITITLLSVIVTFWSWKNDLNKNGSITTIRGMITVTHQTGSGEPIKLDLNYPSQYGVVSDDDLNAIIAKLKAKIKNSSRDASHSSHEMNE
jgi:hypothetical protein